MCHSGVRTTPKQRAGLIPARRRRLVITEVLEDLGSGHQRVGDAIVRSLQDNDGNRQDAAHALGMSRATIYGKISDYGIA